MLAAQIWLRFRWRSAVSDPAVLPDMKSLRLRFQFLGIYGSRAGGRGFGAGNWVWPPPRRPPRNRSCEFGCRADICEDARRVLRWCMVLVLVFLCMYVCPCFFLSSRRGSQGGGGVSRSGLVLSFFSPLFFPFRTFPMFCGIFPISGNSPDWSFSSSWPVPTRNFPVYLQLLYSIPVRLQQTAYQGKAEALMSAGAFELLLRICTDKVNVGRANSLQCASIGQITKV